MAGTWNSLTNQPTFNTSTMILLTDGRIMVQEEGTAHWHALTPDKKGSYINGAWSNLADMRFWRRYYASGVLMDGRVFLCGGEQTGDVGDDNKGEIYDPVADSWTAITTPPWSQVGDAASCVLPDGRVMIGALSSGACIIYDPTTNSWTTTGSQPGRTNEQTWILLPDDTILTVQCFSPFGGQKYVISSGAWQSEGAPPVPLVDSDMDEIGPAMLMYNGKVIFFGAANSRGHGKTAIYTLPSTPTGTGTWTAGPDLPLVSGQTMVCNDCPAALLPNGKVLFAAANYVSKSWGYPVEFFEYDPNTNTIAQAATPGNNNTFPYSNAYPGLYWSRLMLLPSGQVLFSASSNNVQVYQPDGGPQMAWRPTIISITQTGLWLEPSYQLQGTQLNGLSQANIYGDDCYPATNYPLVQLTDPRNGDVYYCRTYSFSAMGVATGTALQRVQFSTESVPPGTYDLRVIANGVSSFKYGFLISKKPYFIDHPLKREFEWYGKLVSEGDPYNWINQIIDPEINVVRQQLKSLQNGLARLNSIIETNQLPLVGEDVAKQARKEARDEGETKSNGKAMKDKERKKREK
jgi:hypothetical protein